MALTVWGAEMEAFAKVPGLGSHAEGVGTNASGNYAHAEGQGTNAYGNYSHSEGSGTTANAVAAHTEGVGCGVSGNYGHAEGNNTTANGVASHAEGLNGTASGAYSHAEGNATTASGISSHAEGDSTIASGNVSSASGYLAKSTAYGQWSHGSAQISARSQLSMYSLGLVTATSGAKPLTFDGGSTITLSGATQNVWVIPYKTCATFQIQVVGRLNTSGSTTTQGGWLFSGAVGRDSTGSARILGTVSQTAWADTTAPGTVALSVVTTDATYNYLSVQVTPVNAANTCWIATIFATEQYTGN